MKDQNKEAKILILEYVQVRLGRDEATRKFNQTEQARLREIEAKLGMGPEEILNASVKFLV